MNRPWMPLYVAEFLADTQHLSSAQTGTYLLLIMHHWQRGSLPTDDATLARIGRMTPAEWKHERSTIARFFNPDWTHSRVVKELSKATDISVKRRAAGEQWRDQKRVKRGSNGYSNAGQDDDQNDFN